MPPLRGANGGLGLEVWEAGSVSHGLCRRGRGGNPVWKYVRVKECRELCDSFERIHASGVSAYLKHSLVT